MSFRLVSAAVAAGALALAAVACGGSTTHRASTTSLDAQWHRVVVCARTHGMPNAPDPRIDSNGQAHFPSNVRIPAETRRACQAMVDRLESGLVRPPTQAEFAALLRYARCMRAHGLADWPDPNQLGEFPIDRRIQTLVKRVIGQADQTCQREHPTGGIHVVQAP